MKLALRGLFWMSVYIVVVVAPLAIAALRAEKPGQGFVTDFSVALGFIALAMMILQFGLVARLQRVAAPFGLDALIQYHRQISYFAIAFAIAHPALVFIHDPAKLYLLNPAIAPDRARFATGGTFLLLLLAATSLWRKRFKMRYELWQVFHGLAAVLIVLFFLAHAHGVGYYSASSAQRGLWLVLTVGLLGVLGWVRLVKPLMHYRRPWIVETLTPERGDACSMSLVPDGHPGFRFLPGQFGWIVVGRSPFALTQHPFSFSSSAERESELTVTIKARGDFTSSIARIPPGTRAYVDGPYGLFTPDLDEGPGFVLIAGGVGITPLISILRTMDDRKDVRPVILFYGSRSWDEITFREALDELAERLNLTLVHVLEAPHEGYEGETGYINEAVLRRHLPERFFAYRYFVCGPGVMMDAMERALVEIGVPDEHINTERFDMV